MTLMKAFAIFAVVSVHCNNGSVSYFMGSWLHPSFYYLTLFVFVSGYFYKIENDTQTFFLFLKQKCKTLVIPYFVWNFFYGLLSTFLRKIGVITYGDPMNFSSFFLRPWIDGHQYHFNIPAWFLLSLFLVSVITCVLRAILRKLHLLNEYALLAVLLAVSVLSIYFAQQGYNYGWLMCCTRTGFLLPFFQLGFMYKKWEPFLDKNRLAVISVLTVVLYLIFVLNGGTPEINCVFARFEGNPILSVATQIIALVLVAAICGILAPAFENSKLVRYIGDHTFTIMMHHPFWIFFLNFGLYVFSRFVNTVSFDQQQFQTTIWYCYAWRDSRTYFFYVVFAMSMPLLLKWLWDKWIVVQYQKQSKK
ncbi:MAG: acyltransferase family protein [Candidatus Fimenecus sp.]